MHILSLMLNFYAKKVFIIPALILMVFTLSPRIWAEEACEMPKDALQLNPIIMISNEDVQISKANFWYDISGIFVGGLNGIYGHRYVMNPGLNPYYIGYAAKRFAKEYYKGASYKKSLSRFLRYSHLKKESYKSLGKFLFWGPFRAFGGTILFSITLADLSSHYISIAYAAEMTLTDKLNDVIETSANLTKTVAEFNQGLKSKEELIFTANQARIALHEGIPSLQIMTEEKYNIAHEKLINIFPRHTYQKAEVQTLFSNLETQFNLKTDLTHMFKKYSSLLEDSMNVEDIRDISAAFGEDLAAFNPQFNTITNNAQFDELLLEAILMYGKADLKRQAIKNIRK